MPHALLVDDDERTLELLSRFVEKASFTTSTATSLAEAREALHGGIFDVVLLDLKLPDGEGLDLMEEMEGDPEVVLVTGHGTMDTAIEALRRDVTDYLVKPVDTKRLQAVLARVARARALRDEIRALRGELRQLGRFGRMVGNSPAMQELYDRVSRVAPTETPVLVSGESGTGKELVARTIHDLSRRRDGPFWAVNCGAISSELIESELFGHEKGAFTGADRRHRGYFEMATGGTLLLDEITEMPAAAQVKLLRVLEGRTMTRVGGEAAVKVDVRVVAASNRPLLEAIEDGALREDLYYRIKVFHIQTPPLRERAEDLPLLANHFLDMLNRDADRPRSLHPNTVELLQRHMWPGNVRELKHALDSAAILADDEILPEHLPPEVSERASGVRTIRSGIHVPLGSSIEEAERDLILATLDHCDGNRKETAEVLGISTRTLYSRLKDYGED